uniref:Uncharacterized protein n=1 Tax=Physcomitrium patens TaxID=3218 RepID=A0A2K1IPD0_PHYPA|nr:hypothetical protein PHYPA_027449 [Physcomitrium patens]
MKLIIISQNFQGLNCSQKVVAQYANDTSLTTVEKESLARFAIDILNTFCRGSALIINYDKPPGYWQWQAARTSDRPP